MVSPTGRHSPWPFLKLTMILVSQILGPDFKTTVQKKQVSEWLPNGSLRLRCFSWVKITSSSRLPGHVPKEERLLFSVALLLETQTFPLHGCDVEQRLQKLLALSSSTRLAQAGWTELLADQDGESASLTVSKFFFVILWASLSPKFFFREFWVIV